jgi:hypothetical protein
MSLRSMTCVGAATLAALSACGGGGTATATAPPSTGTGTASAAPQGRVIGPARDFGDACRLLSVAEVQAALGGGPLTASSRSDPQTGSVCTYAAADGGSPLLTVQVTVEASTAEARDAVDQLGGSPLTGIGDDARLSTRGALGTTVYLARGATLAALTTLRREVPQQALVELARTLAGRL